MALLTIALCSGRTGSLLRILAFDRLFLGASGQALGLVWMVVIVQHQVGVLVDCSTTTVDLAMSTICGCVLLA